MIMENVKDVAEAVLNDEDVEIKFVYSLLSDLTRLQKQDLSFGLAIEALKQGKKVARAGWNGKGMFVYLVPANQYPARTDVAKSFFGEDSLVPYNAYMAIKNVDDTVSTWVPSVNDCLSEDWQIIE
jgi:hypothetical protein